MYIMKNSVLSLLIILVSVLFYFVMSSPSSTQTTSSAPAEERASLSYKDAFYQWIWSASQKDAEQMVLDQVDLVKNPRPGVETSVRDIAIQVPKEAVNTKKPLFLHEFAIESEGNKAESGKTLVMMHGYGAGLGFFYKNFDGLSNGLPGWNIYALDWLGYGLSARPKFSIQTSNLSQTVDNGTLVNQNAVAKETEDWFVESLEAWRKEKNIPQFTLMGHSMGGYFAAAYAFKYPQHVDKLLMVSPAGVERGYTPDLDDGSFWSLFKSDKEQERINEIEDKGPDIQHELDSQTELTADDRAAAVQQQSENLAAAANVKSEIKSRQNSSETRPRRTGGKLLMYLWNNHVSPFTLVRNSFVFGPKLMSRWSYWRFAQFPEAERDAMHLYAYKTFIAKPSGEYAITRILAPGALARMPIVDRVQNQLKCPSVWIYGDHDWMHAPSGAEATDIMNSQAGRKFAEFHVVPKAGHHVYLDNVNKFNSIILNFIRRKA